MDFLKKVLPVYTDDKEMQERGFFGQFFKTKPEYYTNAEYIEIDVKRGSRKIAPTIKDWRTGAVIEIPNGWKENKFRPPYSAMKHPVGLSELMERQFGETDEGEPIADYLGNYVMKRSAGEIGFWYGRLSNILMKTLKDYHGMFLRTMELQCAQVMQTGTLSLKNENGDVAYTVDFGMKATHKPGVSVNWGESNATPLEDIEAACDLISNDGHSAPEMLILGSDAWKNLMKDDDFKERVRKDGLGLGTLSPSLRKKGGIFHGWCDFGTHNLEIYTYGGCYEDESGNSVPYLDPDAAIVTPAIEELDFRLVFGGIPSMHQTEEPFKAVVPATITYPNSIKVYNRVYSDKENDAYTVESKMRGMAVPVSIDKIVCIDTASN